MSNLLHPQTLLSSHRLSIFFSKYYTIHFKRLTCMRGYEMREFSRIVGSVFKKKSSGFTLSPASHKTTTFIIE